MVEIGEKTHAGNAKDTQGNSVFFFGKAEVASSILAGSTISPPTDEKSDHRPSGENQPLRRGDQP